MKGKRFGRTISYLAVNRQSFVIGFGLLVTTTVIGFMRSLLENSDNCNRIEQPPSLEISEDTFSDHVLLAVAVQKKRTPAFDCEFGGASVSQGRSRVCLQYFAQDRQAADMGSIMSGTTKSILYPQKRCSACAPS